ncbi:unnamed protein product [Blepharisma stoltei]|uniref:Uncharacterized protein n=1 Tax=Blepharisma stoltei TaxID=1481888 RepID=A0AAU9IQF3_9CILI|nr:unnamed protein product [Blepharisma stoltei]
MNTTIFFIAKEYTNLSLKCISTGDIFDHVFKDIDKDWGMNNYILRCSWLLSVYHNFIIEPLLIIVYI